MDRTDPSIWIKSCRYVVHLSVKTYRGLDNANFIYDISSEDMESSDSMPKDSPWSRAATPTMISTALPKEALSRPARVWPNGIDIWSVHSPRSYITNMSVRNAIAQ